MALLWPLWSCAQHCVDTSIPLPWLPFKNCNEFVCLFFYYYDVFLQSLWEHQPSKRVHVCSERNSVYIRQPCGLPVPNQSCVVLYCSWLCAVDRCGCWHSVCSHDVLTYHFRPDQWVCSPKGGGGCSESVVSESSCSCFPKRWLGPASGCSMCGCRGKWCRSDATSCKRCTHGTKLMANANAPTCNLMSIIISQACSACSFRVA